MRSGRRTPQTDTSGVETIFTGMSPHPSHSIFAIDNRFGKGGRFAQRIGKKIFYAHYGISLIKNGTKDLIHIRNDKSLFTAGYPRTAMNVYDDRATGLG